MPASLLPTKLSATVVIGRLRGRPRTNSNDVAKMAGTKTMCMAILVELW
jgi:hypothetical protein